MTQHGNASSPPPKGEIWLESSKEVLIRRAEESDKEQIAELANMADGDTISFIVKGNDPTADTLRIYCEMISEASNILSLRNCFVAERGVPRQHP